MLECGGSPAPPLLLLLKQEDAPATYARQKQDGTLTQWIWREKHLCSRKLSCQCVCVCVQRDLIHELVRVCKVTAMLAQGMDSLCIGNRCLFVCVSVSVCVHVGTFTQYEFRHDRMSQPEALCLCVYM